jgi:hypothetical protein
VIAARGGFDIGLGQVPWLPIAALTYLAALLALGRIPTVRRALSSPGMAGRLLLPHTFRVGGVVFLLAAAIGYLPALFALPAGLGDIATGVAAPLAARRLAQGRGRRAALWTNVFGMTDLVVAQTLGALTAFGLLHVTPSAAPIGALPLALIPTAGVPLLFALHIASLSALRRPGHTRSAAPAHPASTMSATT